MFWWYNMYADVDFAATPRPMYLADGRKLPDIHTHPADLRDTLQQQLGPFPLFKFWGPGADIESSRWIARSALHVLQTQRPTLTLVYLPHLDYDLQRLGPQHPGIAAQVAAVDALCAPLIEQAQSVGAHVVVVSEYGITEVSRPVHVNRALREAGWLMVRQERGLDVLDAGASDAFAVADHQLAHVYVAKPSLVPAVKACLAALPGVERVLDDQDKRAAGLDHARSGELVAVSEADSWFTYYHFLDDARAPDYARTVDIHRKPGYDPVELFIDRRISFPKLAVASRLARKVIGMRYLMDVIGLDATVVRGSHGRPTDRPEDGPLFITSAPDRLGDGPVHATAVKQLLLEHLFEGVA
jgi:predicted AlkP superfamily pyrophosphatase or phosphodiesterase